MLDVSNDGSRICRVHVIGAEHVGVDASDLDVAFGDSDLPLVADLRAVALDLEAGGPRQWWDIQDDILDVHVCAPRETGISDPLGSIGIATEHLKGSCDLETVLTATVTRH